MIALEGARTCLTSKYVCLLQWKPTQVHDHPHSQGYEFVSGLHYTVPWSTPLLELTCCSKDTPSFDLMGEPDGTFDRIVIGERDPFKVKLGEKHLPDLYAQFPPETQALIS